MKFQNLSGQKFGKLTVLKRIKNKGHNPHFLCLCECGNLKECDSYMLKYGKITSCGCDSKQKRIIAHTKHNETKTRLYNIWQQMKQRCYNEKSISFIYYGQKNITICNEWKYDYLNFRNWAMNNGYKENLTLDRIDTKGNYCPENCRWISNAKQQRNKNNNRFLTFKNKTLCVAEWSEKTGIKSQTIYQRLRRNWTIERTLTTFV